MKFPILVTALLATISFSAQAQTKTNVVEQIPGIDSLLNQVLKDQNIAGFAVAVVKDNQVIYSKGFGYRDLE
ncbi:MAG: serine hydrolase, partial [Pedobacter sp.]